MNLVFRFKQWVFGVLRRRRVNALLRTVVRPLAGLIPGKILRRLPIVGNVRVALPNGGTLLLASDGRDWIASRIYWRGLRWYEPETMGVFRALLKRSQVVLDIGSNTGLFALVAGQEDPARQVWAFEPVPEIHESLVTNTKVNRLENVKAVWAAVTDFDGQVDLYVPRMVTLPLSSSSRADLRKNTERITVPAMRLDAFVSANQIPRVDLIKIDTEGTEDRVLAGAGDVLRRDRPMIICEVLAGPIEKLLQGLLDGANYRFFHITERGLVRTARIMADATEQERNYLFAPVERCTELPQTLQG